MPSREEIEGVMLENVELYLSSVYAKQLVKDILLDLHLQGVGIKVDSPIVTATANTRVAFEGYSAYGSLI